MKKVIFIRHGKSAWDEGKADIDRSLKNRGIEDGKLIANNLKAKDYKIDAVFSSPANRAYSTCKIFKSILMWPDSMVKKQDVLYDFHGESVLNFVKNLEDKNDTVIIFGHNNALTAIINLLGDRYLDNLPTTGLTVIQFDVESWKYIKLGHSELFMFPRDYKH